MCTNSAPAICFSISSARWLVEPLLLDAALILLPGRLVSATSSLTDFAGTLGVEHQHQR